MINLLPAPRQNSSLKRFFDSKKRRYFLAAMIDLMLIVCILIYGRQPTQRLISPLVSSINSLYVNTRIKTTGEVFAFTPGLAQNKFSRIDMEGLDILSFFDVPLTDEGEINTGSRGFASFKSSESKELFDKARFGGTKVFITLTLSDAEVIKKLLNDESSQQRLFEQTLFEIKDSQIDGATVDFEASLEMRDYQKKFNKFIYRFTNYLHADSANLQLAVAIPSTASKKISFYDASELSKLADRVFLMAFDFAVPESKNASPTRPVYGYSEGEWWEDLALNLNNFLRKVPAAKLVLERAWYGNGDSYPLYTPNSSPPSEKERKPGQVVIDSATIERLVLDIPQKGKDAARKNIPLIAKALEEEGILDSNILAYALATIEHETNETFEPLEEYYGRFSARRLGYEGGTNYFGRGFIQITHLRNYRIIGERIGLGESLVKNPELATNPEIAAKILAAFFKDNNVANLASKGNFIAARTPINPDINARSVAQLAMKYYLE